MEKKKKKDTNTWGDTKEMTHTITHSVPTHTELLMDFLLPHA